MKPVLKNLTYRQPGWVYSVDAHQWDFTQKNAKLGYHKDSLVHPADLSDIHLSKKGVDHEHLRDTSLFNIGGYFHWHDGDETGIFIEQGAVSQSRLNTSHINIVNFEEVNGKVKLYRLEDQNVLPSDAKGDIFNSVFLHIDNINFDNKLVGVVLCGELYWLNVDGKIVKYINHNTLKFDLQRWHLYEKVWKYKDLFSNDKLGLTPYLDGRIKTEEVRKPETIRRLFTLPQSFLVIVESPKPLEITKTLVPSHQLPKRYFVATHHYQPLRCSDGRYLPYIPMEDRNGVVICTEENRYYPQQGDTIIRSEQPYLNELNVSTRRGNIKQAHFINIKVKGE